MSKNECTHEELADIGKKLEKSEEFSIALLGTRLLEFSKSWKEEVEKLKCQQTASGGSFPLGKIITPKPDEIRSYGGIAKIEELLGKTMSSVKNIKNEELVFSTADGHQYRLHHDQDCCEHVEIVDIIGHLDDLVGHPLLMAEEANSDKYPDDLKSEQDAYAPESFTWTFYKFATIKGYVTIRWLGSSNGYYSERVDFVRDW